MGVPARARFCLVRALQCVGLVEWIFLRVRVAYNSSLPIIFFHFSPIAFYFYKLSLLTPGLPLYDSALYVQT